MPTIRVKPSGFITLVFIILFCWLAYSPLQTPAPKTAAEAPSSFSALRALEQLKIIAAEPHSAGTPAHKKLRSYIFDYCKKLGLETRVISETGLKEYGTTAVAGNALNIIAKLPGSKSSKSVLVMSHYDSQPNSLGAADDGSGVAAMLETMALLAKGPKLENDIIFLFTDLEEVGLLGAEAFVNSYEGLSDVGMILNYESRGNDGISFTFETSENNGWIVRVFAASVKKPIANALAYEIYKLMPNGSDFTMFKKTGISGLNSAFIDGFSYYHSMIDNAENISLGSLQHQGDLMFGMTNYFGNLDLINTKSEDVVFFNLTENKLVIYPLSWDIPLIVLTVLFFIVALIMGLKNGQLKISQVLAGFGLYIGSIVLALILVWLLQWLVLTINPHYANFYGNNFYNAGYYLWAIIGLSLLSFAAVFQPFRNKFSITALAFGAMSLLIILVFVLKFFIPTGAFILYIPLLPALLIMLILLIKNKLSPYYHQLGHLLLLIMPLILWVPFVYFLFVVFSFDIPFGSAIFIVLFFPFLLPSLNSILSINRFVLIIIAGLMTIGSLVIGQLNADYSKEQPLQSQLCYMLNLDTNEAMWVSPQKYKDEWISEYIKTDKPSKIDNFYPNSVKKYWRDEAPLANISTTRIEVIADTLVNEVRDITIKVTPGYGTNVINLWLSDSTYFYQIDDRVLENNSVSKIHYYAPVSSGVKMKIISESKAPLSVTLIESKWGIQEKLLTYPLPEDMIFGTGAFSNSMLVRRTMFLQKSN